MESTSAKVVEMPSPTIPAVFHNDDLTTVLEGSSPKLAYSFFVAEESVRGSTTCVIF